MSMDGKGRALDNLFTERVWRSVKHEEVYLHEYTSPKEARSHLQTYFEFYNHKRLHQALDYQPPAEVYFQKREEYRVLKPEILNEEQEERSSYHCLSQCLDRWVHFILPSAPALSRGSAAQASHR